MRIALVGPVRHVLIAPTVALSIAPTPDAMVMALTGGSCPAARTIARPCPFCTTSTVIASGTTSSTIAAHDHCGACSTGRTSSSVPSAAAFIRPRNKIIAMPISNAPIKGGMRLPSAGIVESSNHPITIGAATATSAFNARTRSSPKRRNTPATMPITIGIGSHCIARLTQPVAPRITISAPVA